jgi:hypothetical protein
MKAMRVTAWRRGQLPETLDSAQPISMDAVIWCDLSSSDESAADISTALTRIGVDLDPVLVGRLVDNERYPGVKYEESNDGARSVVAFAASPLRPGDPA